MPIYLEDRKLAKRLLAGDERAFQRFFDDNFPRLYRFALTRLPEDPEGVAEVVQSTLARALERIRSYRGEAALFTWLCVICRNELVDHLRRNARHARHLVLVEDDPSIRQVVESLDAPIDRDPAALALHAEAARLISVALDRLPARYGDALEWKYIEGRSVREIAQRLELSTEAAQSLLARAKRAFRDIYATLGEGVMDASTAQKT